MDLKNLESDMKNLFGKNVKVVVTTTVDGQQKIEVRGVDEHVIFLNFLVCPTASMFSENVFDFPNIRVTIFVKQP